LIVGPSNLTFQWQRELKEKFDEKFLVVKGSNIRSVDALTQPMRVRDPSEPYRTPSK